MSAHKPRRRKENGTASVKAIVSSSASSTGYGTETAASSFTLAHLLAPARKTSQWVLLPVVIGVAVLFRWSVGLWGYSGQGVEPMHGDFEAQRHWMEITTHLPASKWYFYDLEYWGLDYPPLTAYHSYLLGKAGALFNSAWFELDKSRGYESDGLKLYMRATVVLSELVFYIPAAIAVCRRLARLHGASKWEASIALTALLMQPGNLLIDHGHFQYNTVMLGLVLGAIGSWLRDRYALGCALFVGALAFKQMALYYAPAVFAYLLGSCVFPRINVTRFLAIAIATVLAFAVAWAPLLLGAWYSHIQDPRLTKSLPPPELFQTLTSALPVPIGQFYVPLLHFTQSIHRIFPFARGLFEDKVANIWLAIHSVYKLNKFPVPLLTRVSLLATVAAVLPSSTIIFLRPRKSLLPLALASSAWSFFLFSFQVHEKSVLLPLLPMTLLLASEPDSPLGPGPSPDTRAWIGWANVVGAWTMFPLLRRDGQAVPYAAVVLLWTLLLGLPPLRWELYRIDRSTPAQANELATPLHVAFYLVMAVWHVFDAYVAPPDRKPDLWPVINCLVGVVAFVVCWLYCNGLLLYRSGLLDRWIVKDVLGDTGKGEKKTSMSHGTTQGTPKRKA